MRVAPHQLGTGFYFQLLPYSVPQWRAADLFYRDGEKGHLMGRRDGAGGRMRGRSSRQLLGHCLPGVSTSNISQSLFSLASRHTQIQMKPKQHRFAPCLSPLSVCFFRPRSAGLVLYIETVTSRQPLQPTFLSTFDGSRLTLWGGCITQEKLTGISCNLVWNLTFTQHLRFKCVLNVHCYKTVTFCQTQSTHCLSLDVNYSNPPTVPTARLLKGHGSAGYYVMFVILGHDQVEIVSEVWSHPLCLSSEPPYNSNTVTILVAQHILAWPRRTWRKGVRG